MTPHNENPAAARGGTGLPQVVQMLGGVSERPQGSPQDAETQGCPPQLRVQPGRFGSARTRHDCLWTAQEYNDAAIRQRKAALENPECGGTLNRLAAMNVVRAASWFALADQAPEASR